MAMRPHALTPLFAEATSLPGVGPKVAALFDRLLGEPGRPARVLDLLFHLPLLRHRPQRPAQLRERRARHHRDAGGDGRGAPPAAARPLARALPRSSAATRPATSRWSSSTPCAQRLEKLLPVGETRWISGTLETCRTAGFQMVHPDRIVDEGGLAGLAAFEPVYGLDRGAVPARARPGRRGGARAAARPARVAGPGHLAGARLAVLRRGAGGAASARLRRRTSRPTRRPALRLAYDELLASQLALLLVRQTHEAGGRPRAGRRRPASCGASCDALPYSLTGAQATAVEEIRRDLAAPERMLRLLQGDVGSGKTVVALLAMASVVESGPRRRR